MYAERKIAEAVAAGDKQAERIWRYVKANNDRMPPLSQHQKDALRILLAPAVREATLIPNQRSGADTTDRTNVQAA